MFRSAFFALALLSLVPAAASAAPAHSLAPVAQANRVDVQRTCHHIRQTSRRNCTSTRLLQQALRPPLYYPRRYYGTPHYAPFDPYYGYARPFTPDRFYRPYGYYRPFWY